MKAIATLLCLVVATPIWGQAAAPTSDVPVMTTKGAFFALSVADRDASARWYAEKLGLSVVMRAPKQGKGAATVLEGGGLIVELVQQDDAVPLSTAAPALTGGSLMVYGIFKAGIIVDDFDKTIATLRARHVDIVIGPFPPRATQRANAIIRDNAGNYIQFFGAYAPASSDRPPAPR